MRVMTDDGGEVGLVLNVLDGADRLGAVPGLVPRAQGAPKLRATRCDHQMVCLL